MRTSWPKRSAVSFFSKIVVVVLAMLIAGCMRPAKFPRRVKVSQVLDNLKCELFNSFMEHKDSHPWLLKWTIGYTLTLIVNRTSGASTTGSSYVWPVKQGTFGLNLTAALSKNAKQTIEIKGSILNVRDLHNYGCVPDGSNNRGRLLAGNLGLQQWLRNVVPELRGGPTGDGNNGDATGITYTMKFFITTEGKITPSWAFSYGNGRKFSPSFSLSKDKERTHELIVTLNQPGFADPYTVKLDGKKAKRVYVANMPDLAAILAKIEAERATGRYEALDKDVKRLDRKALSLAKDADPKAIAKAQEVLGASIKERDDAKAESDKAREKAEIAAGRVKTPQPSRRRAYDAETQRTIDQAITRQVIRDAFRP